MGKFTISTGPFSIAMLNYQSVNQLGFYSPSFCYCEELTLRQLWSQSHEELRGSNNLIDFLSSALDPWTRSPVAWGELSMTQHDTTWHDIHNMYVRIICICGGTVKSSPWEGLNGFLTVLQRPHLMNDDCFGTFNFSMLWTIRIYCVVSSQQKRTWYEKHPMAPSDWHM
jgi:hypothetical protein